ncbi:DNA replication/repair protein RecF [Floricoccus tropicus]|uniref:DNA replication and repair protein RecF n=1 Tax=Floricoccus tropicus TaxID=1859473 RepID=A0A1E8GL84_9LACT|nr:DNA replication/repair protein RecF [Floricoccus tropicus]OFI48989.1 DNA replication/repair protein RecF [Floricoccus tropicus]
MKLKNISLKNFRNYEQLSLDFHPNLNIFLGQNAQGKTNILESIYFLALTRSHRTSSDKDLLSWRSDNMEVSGTVEKRNTNTPLEIIMSKQGRVTKVNHLRQQKVADYIGQMNVIMFAPEDLSIIKGSPAIRRRFIDMEIGQIRPLYLYDSIRYNKILKERNAYLKFDQANIDETYLSVLDDQLIEYGSKMIEHRLNFIKELERISQELHSKLSHGLENLTINYKSSLKFSKANPDLKTIETDFHEQLIALRSKELYRHQTLLGPHRDDLEFFINDINVGDFGSQGQQRTTALSIKLAEIDLVFEETGEYPILLLDDVMSELDNTRQLDLLEAIIGKTQTFVTTTTLDHLQNLPTNMQIFQVENGEIIEQN